jgi:hypothetical protein
MTRSVFALTLVFGVFQATAAGQLASFDYRRVSGCYALEVGDWNRPLGGDRGFHTLPQSVRLDTTLASHGGRVLSPDISFPYPHRFPGVPRWQIIGDTVHMLWSNGFTPTIVRLTRKADYLEGFADAQSDAIPPGNPNWPRALVIARRIKCKE